MRTTDRLRRLRRLSEQTRRWRACPGAGRICPCRLTTGSSSTTGPRTMRVCTGSMSTRALVQTVDFFTPVVDDPIAYGRIAGANALSDVYAMGGRPLTALAIAGFPKDADRAILSAIFHGGLQALAGSGRRAARRPHRAGPGDQVRLRGHRRGRSVAHLDQRRRAAGRPAVPDQAARHRRDRDGDQVRSRAAARPRTRRSRSMVQLNRAAAEALASSRRPAPCTPAPT